MSFPAATIRRPGLSSGSVFHVNAGTRRRLAPGPSSTVPLSCKTPLGRCELEGCCLDRPGGSRGMMAGTWSVQATARLTACRDHALACRQGDTASVRKPLEDL